MGHFREALRRRTRRTQGHVRVAEPPGHDGSVVTYAHVIGVGLAAHAVALAEVPRNHVTSGLKRSTASLKRSADGRIEFVQRVVGGFRHPLRPFAHCV